MADLRRGELLSIFEQATEKMYHIARNQSLLRCQDPAEVKRQPGPEADALRAAGVRLVIQSMLWQLEFGTQASAGELENAIHEELDDLIHRLTHRRRQNRRSGAPPSGPESS